MWNEFNYYKDCSHILQSYISRHITKQKNWKWLNGMELWIFAGDGTYHKIIDNNITDFEIRNGEPALNDDNTFNLAVSLIEDEYKLSFYSLLDKIKNNENYKQYRILFLWRFLKDFDNEI